jgi:hypothetical protein
MLIFDHRICPESLSVEFGYTLYNLEESRQLGQIGHISSLQKHKTNRSDREQLWNNFERRKTQIGPIIGKKMGQNDANVTF